MVEFTIAAGVAAMIAVALDKGAEAYVDWEHSKPIPSRPYRAFQMAWEGMKQALSSAPRWHEGTQKAPPGIGRGLAVDVRCPKGSPSTPQPTRGHPHPKVCAPNTGP